MPYVHQRLAQVVTRTRKKDDDSMTNGGLIQAFVDARAALLRFLVLRGATPDEAEDVLQDVSLALAAERIGPVADPRAYLYRMTTNHFLGHRRTAGRRLQREGDWVATHTNENPERDEHPSAETRLIAREQVAILQAVLDRLPERTRLVFCRFRIDGESQRVIAAEIGTSISAVEKHLTRAYAAIAAARLRLDGDRGGPRCLGSEGDGHGV